ncbi:MAG TPA: peptidoglycan-binding domain-containing protein [Candidatus Paceibacterota bacterium]|nr:peptidoglycan-binding domain-containing protein [Candidatus Paceibacterota bacterium]
MKKQLGIFLVTGLALLAAASPAFAATISRSMDIGSQNADVTTLQTTLATDPSLYPEGKVTGYFGALTSAAVQRFQAKYGVVSSGSPATTGYGRVGPATIAKFNDVYGNGSVGGADVSAPILSNVGTAITTSGANMLWSTNEPATGIVFYSQSPLILAEAAGPHQAPTITGTNVMSMNSVSNTTNSLALSGLNASSTYYYVIESIDAAGNIQMTWPTIFTTR